MHVLIYMYVCMYIFTACNNSCTGLHQCYGSTASECCNFNSDGYCTDDCGVNRVANSTYHCVCSNFWTGDSCESKPYI